MIRFEFKNWHRNLIENFWSYPQEVPCGNTDLEFRCLDGTVEAHQFWLATNCPGLRSALEVSDHCKNESVSILVPDFSLKIVKKFLALFYTGSMVVGNYSDLDKIKQFGCNQLGFAMSLSKLDFIQLDDNTPTNAPALADKTASLPARAPALPRKSPVFPIKAKKSPSFPTKALANPNRSPAFSTKALANPNKSPAYPTKALANPNKSPAYPTKALADPNRSPVYPTKALPLPEKAHAVSKKYPAHRPEVEGSKPVNPKPWSKKSAQLDAQRLNPSTPKSHLKALAGLPHRKIQHSTPLENRLNNLTGVVETTFSNVSMIQMKGKQPYLVTPTQQKKPRLDVSDIIESPIVEKSTLTTTVVPPESRKIQAYKPGPKSIQQQRLIRMIANAPLLNNNENQRGIKRKAANYVPDIHEVSSISTPLENAITGRMKEKNQKFSDALVKCLSESTVAPEEWKNFNKIPMIDLNRTTQGALMKHTVHLEESVGTKGPRSVKKPGTNKKMLRLLGMRELPGNGKKPKGRPRKIKIPNRDEVLVLDGDSAAKKGIQYKVSHIEEDKHIDVSYSASKPRGRPRKTQTLRREETFVSATIESSPLQVSCIEQDENIVSKRASPSNLKTGSRPRKTPKREENFVYDDPATNTPIKVSRIEQGENVSPLTLKTRGRPRKVLTLQCEDEFFREDGIAPEEGGTPNEVNGQNRDLIFVDVSPRILKKKGRPRKNIEESASKNVTLKTKKRFIKPKAKKTKIQASMRLPNNPAFTPKSECPTNSSGAQGSSDIGKVSQYTLPEHEVGNPTSIKGSSSPTVENQDLSTLLHNFIDTNLELDLRGNVCQICQKVFSEESELTRHLEACHENSFSCNICEEKFGSSDLLLEHKRRAHKENVSSFNCDVCLDGFSAKDEMMTHMNATHETSSQGGDFKCLICGKGYSTQGNMRTHMKFKHSIKSTELI